MTNIAQAISHLSYFFWRLQCSFFWKSSQLAAVKILVPLSSYATPGAPLLPPAGITRDYRAALHILGQRGWISNHLWSYILRTQATRGRGGIIFHSFQLLEWAGGNQYLLSWPNAAIPSPAGASSGTGVGGRNWYLSTNQPEQQMAKTSFAFRRFFFPIFRSYFLKGTFILTLAIVRGDESQFHLILLLSNLWHTDLALLLPLHGKQVLVKAKDAVF